MKKIEQRFVLFLSDPNISDSEFSDLARALESSHVTRLLETAWDIRKQLDRDSRDLLSSKDRSPAEMALREIERMLLVESGIPKGVAIRMLSDKLGYEKPLPSRASFHSAVLTFLRDFDPSKVLSVAHQLRNQYAHEKPSHDWPLGES